MVLAMGVAHGVGKRFAQHRRKAVGDVGGCMLGQNFKLNLRAAVRARAFDNAFELHGKVDGVVVERVDAGAHSWSASSTVRLTSAKSAATPGSSAWTTRRASACSEARGELVPDVIVDLARDAGAFGERRELDFVVPAVGKVAVARFEREGSFLQLVAGTAHALLLAFQLGGA